jgi:putative two-component system response regulator
MNEAVKRETGKVSELNNVILRTLVTLSKHNSNNINCAHYCFKIMAMALQESLLYGDETINVDSDIMLNIPQLYDIGKITVSEHILSKTDKLTNEEFNEMKKHPSRGGKILEHALENAPENEFLKIAKVTAETHHEKWDGSGYPYGLKGTDIPLAGRLMAIADAYEALVSERPYRRAYTHEEAVSIIAGQSQTHFDPALVEIFTRTESELQQLNRAAKIEH